MPDSYKFFFNLLIILSVWRLLIELYDTSLT